MISTLSTQQASGRRLAPVASAVALMVMAASASAQDVHDAYGEFEQMLQITTDQGSYSASSLGSYVSSSGAYRLGFEAVTQYDAASFSRNFIPPDTMGAVGSTQYMAVANGVYGVFDKNTGARLSAVSDVSFWAAAGQTGANGDTRILYNAAASRWVMVSFGASTSDLQIAVSDTDNALGTWKSTKFTGYAGLPGVGGGVADYPTLAMDKNAVYIGTNNFAPATAGGAASYRGTTLNVIPMNSLFNATAPSTTNMQQFVTPYVAGGTNIDRGYAIQGVNSTSSGSTGKIFATGALTQPAPYDYTAYTINNLTPNSAAGATQSSVVQVGAGLLADPGAARQPSVALPANQRVVDALDARVSSSVYEVNGKIYAVSTTAATNGADEARVHWTVMDSNTFAILAQGDIGNAGYDYYQGSIAVNSAGKVVIGYNRSGLDVATGKVSFMAQVFDTAAGGDLVATSGELLLKESLTDDYHNGSTFGLPSSGRQRWGDYSAVSVDPTNENDFYLIGEFAREYNNDAGGHPGGTGGSRWGTWVAMVDVSAVPEPSTWLSMALGLGLVGAYARRRKATASAA